MVFHPQSRFRKRVPLFGVEPWFLGVILTLGGCAQSTVEEPPEDDALTAILPSYIGSQSVGNCWLFTTTAWAEKLHERAGGTRKNFSESYLSYWSMFDNMTDRLRYVVGMAGAEGGYFSAAREVLRQRGLMTARDFSAGQDAQTTWQPNEQFGGFDYNVDQKEAVGAANAWIASGGLKRAPLAIAERRVYVRKALDEFWHIKPSMRATMTAVFGADFGRSVEDAPKDTFAQHRIYRPADLTAAIYRPHMSTPGVGTLGDLVNGGAVEATLGKTPHRYDGTGPQWTYSYGIASVRRTVQRRMQRLLHQGIPVWMGWSVAQAALGPDGVFHAGDVPQYTGRPPAGDGPHASLLIDYQVRLGQGPILPAGGARPAQALLDKALGDDVTFEFWRVQNSWGLGFSKNSTGMNDLEEGYLNAQFYASRYGWLGAAFPEDME